MGTDPVRLEHWNANTVCYRESDCSGVFDGVTRAYGRADCGGGCVRDSRAIAGTGRSVAAARARASARTASPANTHRCPGQAARRGAGGDRGRWSWLAARMVRDGGAGPLVDRRTRPQRLPRPPSRRPVGDHGLATGAGPPWGGRPRGCEPRDAPYVYPLSRPAASVLLAFTSALVRPTCDLDAHFPFEKTGRDLTTRD